LGFPRAAGITIVEFLGPPCYHPGMAKSRNARRSPVIATIGGPPKIKIYRATFRPFDTTKYLDTRALAKVGKATIEVGTLEVPGHRVPIAAEVRRGRITALRPAAGLVCPGRRKASAASLKRMLYAVTREVESRGVPYLRLPMPLAVSRRAGLTIGPIVIVIVVEEDAPCIWIWVNSRYCLVCTFGWICG
jgi:hypothetical protein